MVTVISQFTPSAARWAAVRFHMLTVCMGPPRRHPVVVGSAAVAVLVVIAGYELPQHGTKLGAPDPPFYLFTHPQATWWTLLAAAGILALAWWSPTDDYLERPALPGRRGRGRAGLARRPQHQPGAGPRAGRPADRGARRAGVPADGAAVPARPVRLSVPLRCARRPRAAGASRRPSAGGDDAARGARPGGGGRGVAGGGDDPRRGRADGGPGALARPVAPGRARRPADGAGLDVRAEHPALRRHIDGCHVRGVRRAGGRAADPLAAGRRRAGHRRGQLPVLRVVRGPGLGVPPRS